MTQTTATKKTIKELDKFLKDILPKNQASQESVGQFQTVVDWLSAFKDAAISNNKVIPVLDNIGIFTGSAVEAFSETVGLAKFAVEFYTAISNKLEEKDLDTLGYIVCTLAYQKTLKSAIEYLAEEPSNSCNNSNNVQLEQKVDEIKSSTISFDTFKLNEIAQHDFIKIMNQLSSLYLENIGYSDIQRRVIITTVQRRFSTKLVEIITHEDAKAKFKFFKEYITIKTDELSKEEMIEQHIKYLQKCFNEDPILGTEPFSLSQVYIKPECGILKWGDINKKNDENKNIDPFWVNKKNDENKIIDPFKENNGGRFDLEDAVLKYLGDNTSNETIIIQGTAGVGKSVFTLKLANTLIEKGLKPIRILFKDLFFDTSRDILNVLSESIRINEEEFSLKDNLLDDNLLKTSVDFHSNNICPYVFIIDGWDEICVSSSKSFQLEIETMLKRIKKKFIDGRKKPLVKVILTGRPADAVTAKSGLLSQDTPILTIRILNKDNLVTFKENIYQSLKEPTFVMKESSSWKGFLETDQQNLLQTEILDKYSKFFDHWIKNDKDDSLHHYEIFGSPLLAHLAFRLISEKQDLTADTFQSRTDLYRNLINLTCQKAGKDPKAKDNTDKRNVYSGNTLRKLLQDTAFAITILGQEKISYEELASRLEDKHKDFGKTVDETIESGTLSKLLISYYFKGGHKDLGCEFMHKSFREYFFSEAILSVLKSYTNNDNFKQLLDRENHWEDFRDTDPRYDLRKQLSLLLAPHWLSKETRDFLQDLITIEFKECLNRPNDSKDITLQKWLILRDTLAQLWDWWAEGVHMRPVIKKVKHGISFEKPFAMEITEEILPKNIDHKKGLPRLNVIDAHLGDGLFLLCTAFHYHPAKLSFKDNKKFEETTIVKYQILEEKNDKKVKLFSPSGINIEKKDYNDYFQNYIARINCAGWHPFRRFPNECFMSFINLSNANLTSTTFCGTNLSFINLYKANLYNANFYKANLFDANLSSANIKDATLDDTNLNGAILSDADLKGSTLDEATLKGANLGYADLSGSNLNNADLSDSNLYRADLKKANLKKANLKKAYLKEADLKKADLKEADLKKAYIESKHKKYIKNENALNIDKINWIED